MLNLLQKLANLDAASPDVITEGKVKEMAQDLKSMSDAEFKKTHGMTKAEARKKLNPKSVKEDANGAHGDESISPVHGGNKIKSPEEMTKDVGESRDEDDEEDVEESAKKEDDAVEEVAKKEEDEAVEETLTTESLRHLAGIRKQVAECGDMMGGLARPSTPASISVTAATGQELSSMLRDIMTLAGAKPVTPMDMPVVSQPGPAITAVVGDEGPEDDAGPSVDTSDIPMRKMLDTMNDVEADESYSNSPEEKVAGMDAAVPSGDDMHKKKGTFAKVAGADNPMQQSMTKESIADRLFADYQNFVTEAKKKPSEGMTKKEKSSVVKKAKAGKDIGKAGKGFEKVEKAAKKSGAKDPKAVAAAAMWKQQAKK